MDIEMNAQSRRAFLAGMAGSLALARQQPPAGDNVPTITMDVTRVNILFTVSDKKGHFVTNLAKEDFEVREGRVKQEIAEFSAESDLPLRIAILVDTSNSIRARFRFEIEAAHSFLESVIRKGRDKALIYGFDSEPTLVQDFTDDTEALGQKLRDLRPGGGTALYDAVYAAAHDRLALERPMHKFRRAMIIIGDGDDNASHYTRDQAMEISEKSDVVIYAISTNNNGTQANRSMGQSTALLSEGDRLLKYLTHETGGLTYFPFRSEELEQDFENIANELRSQYSILFKPEPLRSDGLYHPIELRVLRKLDLIVRARQGYYAPQGDGSVSDSGKPRKPARRK
jgi:VWFA-related protein